MSGPQVMVIGLPHGGRLGERALGLGLVHMHRKHRHDRSRDLVLNGKGVFEFAIVALGPAMGAGRSVDKLGTGGLRRSLSSGRACADPVGSNPPYALTDMLRTCQNRRE